MRKKLPSVPQVYVQTNYEYIKSTIFSACPRDIRLYRKYIEIERLSSSISAQLHQHDIYAQLMLINHDVLTYKCVFCFPSALRV